MSTATGYYLVGTSWLHRRNPITKLLAVALVLLATFLLPPVVMLGLAVVLAVVAWSAGLGRDIVNALRIPALLLASIVVVNALFFPGATDRLVSLGPLAVTREGLTFGLISAGRLVVAFLVLVTFLFTTLADDLLEALVARGASHRIAFIVLSAVQMVPRMQARAGSILDAQQARGLAVSGSFRQRVRALVPLIGPVLLGSLIDVRERTFALEARGFGARPGRSAYRVVADPPADHWIRIAILVGIVGRRRPGDDRDPGPVTEHPPEEHVEPGPPGRADRRLSLEAVSVRYIGRREPALSDLDLAVDPGERVGVAGRTGAGKSTLALVAAGFIPRVVRARLSGRASLGGPRPRRRRRWRAARAGRDRLLDPG